MTSTGRKLLRRSPLQSRGPRKTSSSPLGNIFADPRQEHAVFSRTSRRTAAEQKFADFGKESPLFGAVSSPHGSSFPGSDALLSRVKNKAVYLAQDSDREKASSSASSSFRASRSDSSTTVMRGQLEQGFGTAAADKFAAGAVSTTPPFSSSASSCSSSSRGSRDFFGGAARGAANHACSQAKVDQAGHQTGQALVHRRTRGLLRRTTNIPAELTSFPEVVPVFLVPQHLLLLHRNILESSSSYVRRNQKQHQLPRAMRRFWTVQERGVSRHLLQTMRMAQS
ncbi:unnamed protein product [Amoebophrya sp. A120]|nr:unnamed protein product [Amoebophrya sp. A120]|eukprot:GSA120T00020322001.1